MYCYDHWVVYQTKQIKSFETQLEQNKENKFGRPNKTVCLFFLRAGYLCAMLELTVRGPIAQNLVKKRVYNLEKKMDCLAQFALS